MQISDWIKNTTPEERRKVARAAGCSAVYLYYVVKDGCSAGLAKRIEAATEKIMPDRILKKEDLRPDIWSKVEK